MNTVLALTRYCWILAEGLVASHHTGFLWLLSFLTITLSAPCWWVGV